MDLSIIIVNYNVKHFLDQCLHSVQKATIKCNSEIFVVDNNSSDGSVQMLREKYPAVQRIENTENMGFASANNQAIKCAKGKYIVLLNPDTLVEEDTFVKVISFLDKTPDAGGLGVKMIDGKGAYLPESKRGLPTPWVAFYKIFGLSKLFPRSKKFGKYHLSYLDKNKVSEVDVLAGACMFLRKSALDDIGLLDETFFMYGEDIDLSYRLKLGGYKNYYFPETTIIHYKGESTKKSSVNYVKMFYKAMLIFVKKHFPSEQSGAFTLVIQLAIYFRALLATTKRLMSNILLPVIDGLLIWAGFHVLAPLWASFRFEDSSYYPDTFYRIVIPVYIAFFTLSLLLSAAYRKPFTMGKILKGIFWAVVSILIVYSLVAEEFRFSRALIVFGSAWALLSLLFYRFLLSWIKVPGFQFNKTKPHQIAIIGHSSEAKRVNNFLKNALPNSQVLGFIALDENDVDEKYIGKFEQLHEIIKMNSIDELIFCSEDISSATIITSMRKLKPFGLNYKIASPTGSGIVGSNSKKDVGEVYLLNVDAESNEKDTLLKQLYNWGFKLKNRNL